MWATTARLVPDNLRTRLSLSFLDVNNSPWGGGGGGAGGGADGCMKLVTEFQKIIVKLRIHLEC